MHLFIISCSDKVKGYLINFDESALGKCQVLSELKLVKFGLIMRSIFNLLSDMTKRRLFSRLLVSGEGMGEYHVLLRIMRVYLVIRISLCRIINRITQVRGEPLLLVGRVLRTGLS